MVPKMESMYSTLPEIQSTPIPVIVLIAVDTMVDRFDPVRETWMIWELESVTKYTNYTNKNQ